MAGASVLSGRRGLLVAVVVLVAAAAVVLLAAQATWVRVRVPGAAGGAAVSLDVSGSQAMPAAVALGLVALAGVVGLVATRGWVRRCLGGLLVLVGLGIAVGALRVGADPAAAAAGAVRAASVAPTESSPTTYSLVGPWAAVTSAAGLLVALAGLVTVVHRGHWPAMGARYESPAGRPRPGRPDDTWTALDRGEDPTVDPAPAQAEREVPE